MKKRILSLFIVFAMTVSLIPMTASANTPVIADNIPNYVTIGDFGIGFFNFVDGRATHLEIRTRTVKSEEKSELYEPAYERGEQIWLKMFAVSMESGHDSELLRKVWENMIERVMSSWRNLDANIEIYIDQSHNFSGITRIRELYICDYVFDSATAVDSTLNTIRYFGRASVACSGNYAYTTLLSAYVDGTGTVTFGEGDFIIKIGDTLHEIDLNGVTLSNELDLRCCRGDCLIGDINLDKVVTIDDALEILRYLSGNPRWLNETNLRNSNAPMNHALILPESREAGEPSINDALEIIKALAGLPSVVTRLSRA